MPAGADYRVDLSIYQGPMDLLLHLIRERELDIHDIPIAGITEQFLAHLEVIRAIDVDRAGDFLLMAATLMVIKSRMLLPRGEASEDESADDLDPRTDLVQQLLEYKRYKDLSRGLAGAEQERELRFTGGLRPPELAHIDPGKLLEEVGVNDLLLAYERLMRETLAGLDHEVGVDDIPLSEVSDRIRRRLQAAPEGVLFREFFEERRDRHFIVAVFLSLLELLRQRRIALDPGDDVAELRVRGIEPGEPPISERNRIAEREAEDRPSVP
ncbi:MAG: segregation and condensation protein A [Planctomycetaceae bacterium]